MAEDLGHTVYRGPEGETTEWEDLQVKLGNFAPRPKPPKPPPFAPCADDDPAAAARRDPSSAAAREWLDSRTAQELERLADEGVADDDRELERHRQRRLAQLRAAAAAPRFGALDEMPPPAFVLQVTEASRRHWVVCHLYRDGHPGCAVMDLCLMELAQKYPRTHFVRSPAAGVLKAKSGSSGAAAAGPPDAHLPTLLLYRDGACKRHVAGMSAFGGERRVTPEQLALTLNVMGDGRVCSNVADEEEEEGAEGGGGGAGGGGSAAAATFAQRKREQEEQMLALAGQLARRGGLGGEADGGGEDDDGVERKGGGDEAGGGGDRRAGGGVRRSTLARRAADSDESSDFD